MSEDVWLWSGLCCLVACPIVVLWLMKDFFWSLGKFIYSLFKGDNGTGTVVVMSDNDPYGRLWKKWQKITPEYLMKMIANGFDVNHRYRDGSTPLMVVDEPEVVKILLKAGADVNERDKGEVTALIHACRNNSNPEVIECLLKNGANITDWDKLGFTAIMWAFLANSNFGVIDVLLKYGANINDRDRFGWTVLMWVCAYNSHPEIIEMLLQYGADIKAKDDKGKTALDYAKENPKICGTEVYQKMCRMMNE